MGESSYLEICGFRLHVHKAVFLIAVIAIAFTLLNAIIMLYNGKFVILFFPAVSLVVNLLLLYGNMKKKGILYWPYLVWTAILICINAAYFIYIVGCALNVFHPWAWLDYHVGFKDTAKFFTGQRVVIGIAFFVVTFFYVFFSYVVYKGFNYLKTSLPF
ncbi:unnamed protein product [Bursaphelenchus xylophilus]|uniref:(pine wood nematode) hypothetical protein n=1 Tax=Bursaphelenchus xylophilus TaxID=6326 RepID=A0A1I7RYP9_BURXY|nr:unnamed protein product [Bursaphelenchus xylophilus]CAG9092409.1 unnamed protein product [Bursaphelenchus xylophilus]